MARLFCEGAACDWSIKAPSLVVRGRIVEKFNLCQEFHLTGFTLVLLYDYVPIKSSQSLLS